MQPCPPGISRRMVCCSAKTITGQSMARLVRAVAKLSQGQSCSLEITNSIQNASPAISVVHLSVMARVMHSLREVNCTVGAATRDRCNRSAKLPIVRSLGSHTVSGWWKFHPIPKFPRIKGVSNSLRMIHPVPDMAALYYEFQSKILYL